MSALEQRPIYDPRIAPNTLSCTRQDARHSPGIAAACLSAGAPFPGATGSARRASQPISQGAQSHTTPPQQQPQPQQQQPLFGLRFPGPHGGRLSRSAKALSLIQRRGGGGGGGGSSSSSRCSVMMNFSSVPGRWAGRPVREDCARRNVNEGVYGPSCPKGLEMIYKAYLEPWPGQAAVT